MYITYYMYDESYTYTRLLVLDITSTEVQQGIGHTVHTYMYVCSVHTHNKIQKSKICFSLNSQLSALSTTCSTTYYPGSTIGSTCTATRYLQFFLFISVQRYASCKLMQIGPHLFRTSARTTCVLRTYYYYKQYIYMQYVVHVHVHMWPHMCTGSLHVCQYTHSYIPVYQLRVRDTDTWTYVWYRCTFFNIQGTRVQCTCMYRYMYNTKTNLFFYMRYNLLLL